MTIEFGAYAQIHEEGDNTMTSRTTGALTLRPTGNIQGGYCFLSLSSGRRVTARTWTELPIPQDVILQVAKMAKSSKITAPLSFRHRDRRTHVQDNEINDITTAGLYDEYSPSDNSSSSSSDSSYDPDTDSDADSTDTETSTNDFPKEKALEEPPIHEENEGNTNMSIHDVPPPQILLAQPNRGNLVRVFVGNDADLPPALRPRGRPRKTVVLPDARVQEPPRRSPPPYNLRPRHAPSLKSTTYKKTLKPATYVNSMADLEEVLLTQLSLKKGPKAYGEEGAKAVLDEMKLLHNMKAISPCSTLSHAQIRRALTYLMYIKKEKCGRVKGRGCADGRRGIFIV